MTRGAWLLGFALGASACDLSVSSYGGAKIEMTLAGVRATAPRHHVELWARDGAGTILRLQPARGVAYVIAPIVPAVDEKHVPADPCLINRQNGAYLTEPGAWDAANGDPSLQARAVELRMRQLTGGNPLLALTSYDGASPPAADDDVGRRLATCSNAYWGNHPYAYTGNPVQLTAPINGVLYGTIDYTSTRPAQITGGIEVKTPFALHDLTELWLTDASASVAALDPDEIDCDAHADTCRGRIIAQGDVQRTAYRGVLHVELRSSDPAVSGAATVYTHLDDPGQLR